MSLNTYEHGMGREIARRLNAAGVQITDQTVRNHLNGSVRGKYAKEIEAARTEIVNERLNEANKKKQIIQAQINRLKAELA